MKVNELMSVQEPEGEHHTQAVGGIAETGNGEQGAEHPGDVAGSVGQVADQEQVQTEQELADVPNVIEGSDSRRQVPAGVRVGVRCSWSSRFPFQRRFACSRSRLLPHQAQQQSNDIARG